MDDKAVGEIWRRTSNKWDVYTIRELIRKLVEERAMRLKAEFRLQFADCEAVEMSDARWIEEALKEFGIPEETWR